PPQKGFAQGDARHGYVLEGTAPPTPEGGARGAPGDCSPCDVHRHTPGIIRESSCSRVRSREDPGERTRVLDGLPTANKESPVTAYGLVPTRHRRLAGPGVSATLRPRRSGRLTTGLAHGRSPPRMKIVLVSNVLE